MSIGSATCPASVHRDPSDLMPQSHECLWEHALPFLDVRSNDIHTMYSYNFARRLTRLHAGADPEVVLPAVILHDIGWSTVPEDKVLEAFGPKMRYPKLRRQHEVEGAAMAREILETCQHDPALIETIVAIIDGHDTRKKSLSLNDSIVRDADKLWRYTMFGLETNREWFGYSTPEQLALLEEWLGTRFYTDTGRHMAEGLMSALELSVSGEDDD